jgi:hypothetical protein
MASTRAQIKPDTLGLGDGDDIDLILAVESSFGVRFGDETTKWFTVGDLYGALLASLPDDCGGRSCSTSMAFYRLRAALLRRGFRGQIRPESRVAGAISLPPKQLFAGLSTELGISPLSISLSSWGALGFLLLLVGLSGIFFTLHNHALWPTLLLMPAGIGMTSMDVGAYRSTTVGQLARRIAAQNFRHFVELGADARPPAAWRALRDLIADRTDFEAARITPHTRLMA